MSSVHNFFQTQYFTFLQALKKQLTNYNLNQDEIALACHKGTTCLRDISISWIEYGQIQVGLVTTWWNV